MILIRSVIVLDGSWYLHQHWFLGVLIGLYLLFPALKALFDSDIKAFKIFKFYKFINSVYYFLNLLFLYFFSYLSIISKNSIF